jgi:hypothetical protein
MDPHSFLNLDPDPGRHSLKKLPVDPDPHKVNAYAKHCSKHKKTPIVIGQSSDHNLKLPSKKPRQKFQRPKFGNSTDTVCSL